MRKLVLIRDFRACSFLSSSGDPPQAGRPGDPEILDSRFRGNDVKYASPVIGFLLGLVLAGAVLAVPLMSAAQTSPPAGGQTYCPGSVSVGTYCLKNPLEAIGVNSPEELVLWSFKGFAALIGAIAIAFTVFSGFKLLIATTEEAIEEARKSVTWAVGGFIVALLSFTLISGTAKILGFEPSQVPPLNETNFNNVYLTSPLVLTQGLDPGSFIDVMNFVMQNFLGLLGFASTFMIIYYGYRYLTSAGNEERLEKAKTGLRWSVTGLAITLLSYTIIAIVQRYLVYGL